MEQIDVMIPENSTRRADWWSFGLCFMAYLLGGTVSTLLSVFLPVILPEFRADASSGALLNATFIYGWVLGGLGFGLLADRLGRVLAIALATALVGLFTLVSVWSGSWPMC